MAGIKRTAADAAFSDAIRLRDNYTCRRCQRRYDGPHQGYQCAHIIHGRRSASTRYCADNAMGLCATCHNWLDEHPFDATAWLTEELGQGHIDLVHEKHRAHLKTNEAVRKEITRHYRAEIKRMEETGLRDLISYN